MISLVLRSLNNLCRKCVLFQGCKRTRACRLAPAGCTLVGVSPNFSAGLGSSFYCQAERGAAESRRAAMSASSCSAVEITPDRRFPGLGFWNVCWKPLIWLFCCITAHFGACVTACCHSYRNADPTPLLSSLPLILLVWRNSSVLPASLSLLRPLLLSALPADDWMVTSLASAYIFPVKWRVYNQTAFSCVTRFQWGVSDHFPDYIATSTISEIQVQNP